MLLNLNDTESILAWWKVWPVRHNEYLGVQLAARPQFASAIREAQRRIASDAELQALLARSVRDGVEQLARQTEREGSRSSQELRWQELAMAA